MKAVTLWCFILLFSLHAAFAIVVPNMTVSQVSVPDRSALNLAPAIQAALTNTLIKLSGNPTITDNPTIKTALQHPDEWVQSYEYIDNKNTETDTSLSLQVHFDADGLANLLKEANQSMWDANRPLTLFYLRTSDLNDADVQKTVSTIATDRGIPLIFPDADMSQQVFKEAVQAETFFNARSNGDFAGTLCGRWLVKRSPFQTKRRMGGAWRI